MGKPSCWDILLDTRDGDGDKGRPGGDAGLGDPAPTTRDGVGDEALYDNLESGGGLLARSEG